MPYDANGNYDGSYFKFAWFETMWHVPCNRESATICNLIKTAIDEYSGNFEKVAWSLRNIGSTMVATSWENAEMFPSACRGAKVYPDGRDVRVKGRLLTAEDVNKLVKDTL